MDTSRVVLAVAALTFALGAAGAGQLSGSPAPQSGGAARTTAHRVAIGTGELSGTVVAADTGRPVRGVEVSLTGKADPDAVAVASTAGRAVVQAAAADDTDVEQSAVTDENGRFTFEHLPPGSFRVWAGKSGFLGVWYGQLKPARPGMPLALGPAQHVAISISLIRGGVVSGLVFGDDGEPAGGARVQALQSTKAGGATHLQMESTAETDDRGAYRLAGLYPGEYIVSASAGTEALLAADRADEQRAALETAIGAASLDTQTSAYAVVTVEEQNEAAGTPIGGLSGYLPTYFPSASSPATAVTLVLGAGEERDGVDIRTVPVRGTDIHGAIANMPASSVEITVANDGQNLASSTMSNLIRSPDNTFVLRNLAPGQYTVFAATVMFADLNLPAGAGEASKAPALWGRTSLTIDGQSRPNVIITLQPGRTISGRVVFDTVRPPDLSHSPVRVALAQKGDDVFAGPMAPPVTVDSDGRFTLTGVSPGKYSIGATGGAFVESSIENGVDTLDFPLNFDGTTDLTGVVVTVSDHPADVHGAVTDANGRPITNRTVVLAPQDSRFWTFHSRRIRTDELDSMGRYAFEWLPAGDYWIAAIADLDPDSLSDPDVLKTLSAGAVHVTIGDGAQVEQNIRLAQ